MNRALPSFVSFCCTALVILGAERGYAEQAQCGPRSEMSHGHCCPRGARWSPQQCPVGWRWNEERCQCENPCPASPWQRDHLGVDFVIATAEAQSQCEELFDRAVNLADGDAHEEAGEVYVTIYRDYRDQCQDIAGHCMDEVLSRAAQSFDKAGRMGAAIQIRRRLVQDFSEIDALSVPHGEAPESFVGQAFRDIAKSYSSLASYQKAADYFEMYARDFAEADGAMSALARATELRLALGQESEALSNGRELELRFEKAPRDPDEVTHVVLSLGDIYARSKSWSKAERHYSDFLERYREYTAPDLQIVTLVRLGQVRWAQGGDAHRRADESFAEALRVVEATRSSLPPSKRAVPRQASTIEAIARARFFRAERARERVEEVQRPTFHREGRLRLEVRSWWARRQTPAAHHAWESALAALPVAVRERRLAEVQQRFFVEQRLQPWLRRVTDAISEARTLYDDAARDRVPEWEVASIARQGEMALALEADLLSASNDTTLSLETTSFLEGRAREQRAEARRAFLFCLERARESRWSGHWSRRCESALHEVDPDVHPLNDELTPTPSYTYSPLAIPRLVEHRESSISIEMLEE